MYESMTEGRKQAKKLLIVVTPLMNTGGTARRLKLWTHYLREEFEVRILCWTYEAVAEVLRGEGAAVRHDKTLGRLGRCSVIPGVLSISSEIRRYTPDVIISMFVWADFLTSHALARHRFAEGGLHKNPPHIVHLGGNPVPPKHAFSLGAAQECIYGAMVKKSLVLADRIICIDNHDKDMVVSEYSLSDKKVQVIPIGIELSDFSARRGCHDPFTFGVVSRLSREKNVEVIIRAVKGVLESGKKFRLAIFGDGPERERLERLAGQMGLGNHVAFHGWIPEPAAAFAAIDCLLMFSDTEGTPRAILEAGEKGVPVIARAVGGIGELVQDGKTGYLVNTQDELREKMTRIVDFPHESIEFGNGARRFIEARHSIHTEIGALKALMKSVT
jgi:glycosyltransferase involved in cell wall biosynthesis